MWQWATAETSRTPEAVKRLGRSHMASEESTENNEEQRGKGRGGREGDRGSQHTAHERRESDKPSTIEKEALSA